MSSARWPVWARRDAFAGRGRFLGRRVSEPIYAVNCVAELLAGVACLAGDVYRLGTFASGISEQVHHLV